MRDPVFLGNQGIIIGADNLQDLRELLYRIFESLKSPVKTSFKKLDFPSLSPIRAYGQEYFPLEDNGIRQLTMSTAMFSRIKKDWPLYPDYIIFFGIEAAVISNSIELEYSNRSTGPKPDIFYYRDFGVFRGPHFSEAS